MALWEEFSKKAGETARNFGARAKEIAETTKLNSQIAVKKTETERLYGEIGKAFFALRAGRSQDKDELEELCLQVEQISAEIAQLQTEVDVIRQVRRCKNCGEVSGKNSRFCVACGTKFDEDGITVSGRVCKNCGVVSAEESRFCMACGTKFDEEGENAAQPADEAKADEGVEITWPQADEPKPEEPNNEE